jgi:hypothetical protein
MGNTFFEFLGYKLEHFSKEILSVLADGKLSVIKFAFFLKVQIANSIFGFPPLSIYPNLHWSDRRHILLEVSTWI